MLDDSSRRRIEQLFTLLDHDKDGHIDTADLLSLASSNEVLSTHLRLKLAALPAKRLSYPEFSSLFDQIEQIENMQLVTQPLGQPNAWIPFHVSDTAKHLIAGGVAGAISRTVVNPMERIKILFQIQGPDSAYRGIIPTLKKIWTEEGFRGLMAGNGTNVIRIIPYSASQFASYEYFKSLMNHGEEGIDNSGRLIAGALAGIVSVCCSYPLDLVKTRLAIQSASLSMNRPSAVPQKLPGILTTMNQIYKHEGGVFGLYRGVLPTTLGVSPYVAISFWSYETLKSYVDNETPVKRLLCGALAGSIAQTVIYPFDVLRRRFQIIGMGNSSYKYSGTLDALQTMVRQEGVRSLYRGLLPNYLKVGPAIGVSFVSYETCKDVLNRL